MHKLGMGAPNDGAPIDALLEMPFGAHLVIHDGAGSLDHLQRVRERYGHDVLVIVRFNHRISDPTQDIVNDFAAWAPVYFSVNGGGHTSLLFTWENEPDGDEGAHTPAYVRDRLIEVNHAIRRALAPRYVPLAGPNLAKMGWYDPSILDLWIEDGGWRNIGLRNAIATFDLILVHGYGDPQVVRAYRDAIENPHVASPDGTFQPNPLARLPWGFSEYSAHTLSTISPDPKANIVEFTRQLYLAPSCVCGILFIWSWGGYPNRAENIVRDRGTLDGCVESLRMFPQVLTPVFPRPLDPLPPPTPEPVVPVPTPEPIVIIINPPQPTPGGEYFMEPMRKRMMVWNPNSTGERTADHWRRTLHEVGDMDALSIKWWQRDYFMGAVRSHVHPLVPHTLDDVKRLTDAFKKAGVVHIPWGVPMGHNWRKEADFAADIALACDGLIEIDLEPYGRDTPDTSDDFWVGDWRNIPPFFKHLKDRGVRHVICNFDARDFGSPQGGWRVLHLPEIAPYVDHFCTQSYDVGFNVPFRPLYDTAVGVMRQVGAKSMGVVADARALLGIADRAHYAQQLGCNELACWAGDMAHVATYEGFAAFPLLPYLSTIDGGWVPPPGFDEAAEWEKAYAVATAARAAVDRLVTITTPNLTSFEEPDGTVIDLTDMGFVLGEMGRLIVLVREQMNLSEEAYGRLLAQLRGGTLKR